MKRLAIRFLLAAILGSLGVSATSAQADPALEKKARAILATHCFKCHSHEAGKAKGDLMLDTRAFMLKGGDNGPSLVPGDPAKSLLIKSVFKRKTDL